MATIGSFDTADQEKFQHLLSRDVQSLDFPNRIYALGGGGIQMALQLFQQDWFAIEAMRNTEDPITVHLVDTATEGNIDSEVGDIQTDVNLLEQKLRDENQEPVGEIQFNYTNVTSDIIINSYADLSGQQTADSITNNTPADHWWVRRNHLHSKTNSGNLYDVSKGVIKRRSLGKAMHSKAIVQSPTYEQIFSGNLPNGQVAILVGLGGGTGSGLLIDVAQKIRDYQQAARISVFGTLPTLREHSETKANAYAALSELEYLHLLDTETDSERVNPFDDVLLFPLEPTGHNQDSTRTQPLCRFDRAMGYAFVSVYNNPNADFALGSATDFAPFTIAVPQVIHYNRDKVAEAKEDALDMLKNKRNLLNKEYAIFNQIERYLNNNYQQIDSTGIDESDLKKTAREYLHDRVNRFERLVEYDLFNLLGYEIVTDTADEILETIYTEEFERGSYSIEEALESQEFGDVIDGAVIFLDEQNVETETVDDYNELTGQFVEEILLTELSRIKKQYELFCRIKAVQQHDEDDLVSRVLEYLLNPEVSSRKGRDRYRNVKKRKQQKKRTEQEKISKIKDIDDDINSERQKKKQMVSDKKTEWYGRVDDHIADYQNLDQLSIGEKLTDLETSLDNFKNKVRTTDNPRGVPKREVKNALESIEDELRGIESIEFDEREDIEDDLDKLVEVRSSWDNIQESAEDTGFILSSDPDISDERQVYIEESNKLNYFSAVSCPNSAEQVRQRSFSAEVMYDRAQKGHLGSKVDTQKEEAKTEINNEFKDILDDITQSIGAKSDGPVLRVGEELPSSGTNSINSNTKLERKIEEFNSSNLTKKLIDFVEAEIESRIETNIPALKKKRESVKQEKSDIENKIELLENIIGNDDNDGLYTEIASDAKEIINMHDSYKQALRRGIKDDSGVEGVKVRSDFIQDVSPKNTEAAINKAALSEGEFLSSSGEKERIKTYLERIIRHRFFNKEYLGLEKTTIKSSERTFQETTVHMSIIGEVVNSGENENNSLQTNDFNYGFEGSNSVSQKFSIENDDNYEEWCIQNSDPWEVGICAFVQGISFMDNLTGISGGNKSYSQKYWDHVQQSTPQDMIVRHTLGLEDGRYFQREMTEDHDKISSMYLQDNQDIVKDLRRRYSEVDIS